MEDLESMVSRVWNPQVRPLVREAWSAYNAGAIRSAIVMTWVAVCTDLTSKVMYLHDDGDGRAKEFAGKIASIHASSTSPSVATTQMQQIESTILETATDMLLIDRLTHDPLVRLRSDRHLCAHPSMRTEEEIFTPRPEVARAHLATALEDVLTHPPVQGKRLHDAFLTYIHDPSYVKSDAHVRSMFYDRAHERTQKSIVVTAVRHSLLELNAEEHDPLMVADRMADCVHALVVRNRKMIEEAVHTVRDRFGKLSNKSKVRALLRWFDLPEFWSGLGSEVVQHLNDVVSDRLKPLHRSDASMPDEELRELACLVRFPECRQHLPTLVDDFRQLSGGLKEIMITQPHRYFAQYVPEILHAAINFRSAELIGEGVVLRHAEYLSSELLDEILVAWSDNRQCRQAHRMREVACLLYEQTNQLPQAGSIWKRFLERVKVLESDAPWHGYEDLELKLDS